MHLRIKSTLILLLCSLLLISAAPAANASSTYEINGADGVVTLPAYGLAPGAWSTNCWEFAQTVYKLIWGVNFTGDRGTKDDLLRGVPAGEARAITTENTKNYISAAALGSTIRISTWIDGDDNNGRFKHSMILIDKDDEGFTVYEGSINGRVRIIYRTFYEFANGYFGRNYGYFKYIKWPGAPAYGEPEEPAEPAPITCQTAAVEPEYLPGDTDADGRITSADARKVLRCALLLEEQEPGTLAYLSCDMDNDSLLTVADARLVLRAAMQFN